MKDLTKYFIDLSKCSEEQRKSLPRILIKAGEFIYEMTENMLNSGGLIDEDGDGYFVLLAKSENEWTGYLKSGCIGRTELTYPEFIKLFEEPTKLPSELLKEYFKNTPREQVLKDWESTSDYDNVNSPKVLKMFEGESIHESFVKIQSEIPDPTAQLKADKVELLEALEETNRMFAGYPNFQLLYESNQSLIQKHKK